MSIEKIKSLKHRQLEKNKQIEIYQTKSKKVMFWVSLVVSLTALFFLEDSYLVFGSLENFVILIGSILLTFILVYNAVVFLLIRKRRKEIKKINGRIFRLMKLKK